MARFVTKIQVNKPAEHIFNLYLDDQVMAHWVSGFKGIEVLRGEPREEDSLYRMFINFNGEDLHIYQKLLEVQPCERLLIQMEHPDFYTYSEVLFQRAGCATELFCKVKIEGKTMRAKLAMPLVKSILENRNNKDYLLFKQVAERLSRRAA